MPVSATAGLHALKHTGSTVRLRLLVQQLIRLPHEQIPPAREVKTRPVVPATAPPRISGLWSPISESLIFRAPRAAAYEAQRVGGGTCPPSKYGQRIREAAKYEQ